MGICEGPIVTENGWAFRVVGQRCHGPNGCLRSVFRTELECVMPAILALTISASAALVHAAATFAVRASRSLKGHELHAGSN